MTKKDRHQDTIDHYLTDTARWFIRKDGGDTTPIHKQMYWPVIYGTGVARPIQQEKYGHHENDY